MTIKSFWVSRDAGISSDDCVMITQKKPTVERGECEACSHGATVQYMNVANSVVFGADGELGYYDWLKLTGIEIEKGELYKVQVVIDE